MGKGSAPRPKSVNDDIYSANWALIQWNGQGQEETQPESDENGQQSTAEYSPERSD